MFHVSFRAGRIIDCAFTHYFNPRYDPLAKAVREPDNGRTEEKRTHNFKKINIAEFSLILFMLLYIEIDYKADEYCKHCKFNCHKLQMHNNN